MQVGPPPPTSGAAVPVVVVVLVLIQIGVDQGLLHHELLCPVTSHSPWIKLVHLSTLFHVGLEARSCQLGS